MDKLECILPGSIRSKKNSKVPAPLPCAPGSKSTLFKRFSKKGLVPVRITLQPSTAYRHWEDAARKAIALQGKKQSALITSDVHVKAVAYIKGVAPDLSGMTESVGDCIQGVIIEDDKQIKSWDGSRVFRDKANPRTEIEITPYTEG